MTAETLPERLRRFPDFTLLPEEAAADLGHQIQPTSVKAGTLLAAQGEPCQYFPSRSLGAGPSLRHRLRGATDHAVPPDSRRRMRARCRL